MTTSGRRDYVPANAVQFAIFMHNMLEYVNGKKTEWKHIPQETINHLWDLYDAFKDALEITQGQHTPAQTLDRNEKLAAAKKALREFANQYLRFAPVTNVDRAEMGVPNHDTIRTNHVEVHEMVEFLPKHGDIRQIAVDFWIQGADHKAKPAGYDGAVIVWDILDNPPTDHSQLTHHALASRTPFKLHFDESERRKQVFIAMCWQNARGIQGHWSEIKSIYIP